MNTLLRVCAVQDVWISKVGTLKVAMLFLAIISAASECAGAVFQTGIYGGRNYEVAAFSWWHSDESDKLKGILVLVPGSNKDGRDLVREHYWQKFAFTHHLALVGCYFKDNANPHPEVEEYSKASAGSGTMLLHAIRVLSKEARHREAASAPLLLWGHSAGGQFNYEFTCWRPDLVRAFVVNKGGFYFTKPAPEAAKAIPGIFFIGGKDEPFRETSIRGIFGRDPEGTSNWQLKINADEGHEIGKTKDMAVNFFETILKASLVQSPRGLRFEK